MNKRIVRVAAAQIAPVLDEPGGTLAKVVQAIDEAATKGVRLIVFPETILPYYPYFSFVEPPVAQGSRHLRLIDEAVTIPGRETEALATAARRHAMVLVVGVNERVGGTLYNAQLVFDADGSLLLKRRKITPTYHERMIWGQGDGAGLTVVDSAVGRIGALACWEHYNPLARFALMTQNEEIHAAQFPGSLVGQVFADQMEVTIRHHALESGCFVVNATGWLSDAQIESISADPKMQKGLRGGNCTAIVTPEGRHLVPPMTAGEGLLIGDCDMALIAKRKRMMDSAGHYARPDLLRLHHDDRPHVLRQASSDAPDAVWDVGNTSARPPGAVPSLNSSDIHDRTPDGTADQRVAVLRSAAG